MTTTAAQIPAGTTHLARLVAEWARRTPGTVAVTSDAGELTYAELDAQAERLAAALRERGVGPEDRVCVALPRSPRLVAALLGVLKSGAAYVPVDPDYPQARQRFIAEDAGAALVVTDAAGAGPFDGLGVDVLSPDAEPTADGGAAGPAVEPLPGNLAYVVYTSGSTGTPKGVMVPHSEVVRFVQDDKRLDITAGDVVAQLAPASFDASVFEIWSALARGATVAIVPTEPVSVEDLGRRIRALRPDWLFLTSGLFRLLAERDSGLLGAVGTVITGGDVLSPEHMEISARATRRATYAAYGPTETTVFASLHRIDPEERTDPVPLGSALAGTVLRVLDDDLRPVPQGTVGELYVSGSGVARGYLGRPGLTAERFLPDPYATTPGARMYRTGDLASERADGTFEFHGRTDRQVKIRGFRIEPGEIEAVLATHPGVSQAVVAVFDDGPQLKRLAAFLTLRDGADVAVSELRQWAADRLPAHLLPAAFTVLDAMPLDPNRKTDRAALPYPWAVRDELGLDVPFEAPAAGLEQAVAAVWAQTLELDRVGADDNFFDLGGDSLRSVVLIQRLAEEGIAIPAEALFDHQTVRELAAYAAGHDGSDADAA
ncbi:hypothetical protein C3486_14910 [Streptomyces sp. Ru73]|uniref:non-ribosomal peptide synthetase n=1 Tax=Streptomyces sp. Ru73 TaxID=2080748 RepID=UPI000CDDAA3A|nr:non-ribosomal peptide synthetase [Streptomyces sp. Ru73]POX40229.1 hypothetical protein C3486_14910 [Streptomyces sp. Ru73]